MNNMKTIFFGCALLFATAACAQKDYKVVFDVTSKDSAVQQAVMRWVQEITGAHPDALVEVVMYGQGVNLVVKGKSAMENAVTKYGANPNVMFKVCNVALKNQHIEKDQLLPGVTIVPDGIYEVISKQREGWGYIKAAH